MFKIFTYIVGITVAFNSAIAEEIPFSIQGVVDNIKDIHVVALQLDTDDGEENIYWYLTLPQRYVMSEKLFTMDKHATLDRTNFLPYRDESYKGVVIQANKRNGDRYSNLRVFNGRITDDDDNLVRYDLDRWFEFWLLGTAQTIEQQYIIASTIPIISFEQCKMLGNKIIATEPKQCILTTGDILMEIKGGITEEALAVNTFDECLMNGQNLIKSFPRKCIAAGGRIFLEPKRKNVGRKLKEFVWE